MHREKRPERVEEQMLKVKETAAAAEEAKENETDYRMQSEARLYENEREIALLKTRDPGAEKKSTASGKIKSLASEKKRNDIYKARIDSLERRNHELRSKLNTYKKSDKTAWDRFRKEFSGDLDQLRQALKDIGTTNAEDDSKN
ncbi:MAG: hypothetical protein ACXVPQ_05855 [Bacteroidia bacterium]